jgi:hypothetical protein
MVMTALNYRVAPLLLASVILASTASAQQAEPKIAGTQVTERELPGTRSGAQATPAAVRIEEPVRPTEVLRGDHVASGVALRNRGGGEINLRGVPPKATPIAAFLYWDILADQAERSVIVSVNGAPVEASLIGKGASPCWSPGANLVYRAKVPLNLLYIGINGDYKIAGIPSSEGFGMDPWQSSPGPIMAEGATLVVFYLDESSPFKRTFVYEAPISGQMFTNTFDATLTGFSASRDSAKFTLLGADGQVGGGLATSFPVTAETSFFEGIQIAGPPASGTPPASLNANSDWNGEDGHPLNQLWDTRTHIVPIKEGAQSGTIRYVSQGDCLVVVAFILSL